LLVAQLREDATAAALQELCAALSDVDVAAAFAGAGGHTLLLRLSCSTDEDVAEAAASCIAAALHKGVPGCDAFPVRTLCGAPPVPGVEDACAFLRTPPTDSDLLPDTPAPRYCTAPPGMLPPVWSHPVSVASHRMAGQRDVGQLLWPSAPLLGRWAVAHRAWLAGREVLEIGAGMGLTGCVAALAAAVAEVEARQLQGCCQPPPPLATRVVLSDYVNEVVLANLMYNVALNDPSRNRADMGPLPSSFAPLSLRTLMRVQSLDWDEVAAAEGRSSSGKAEEAEASRCVPPVPPSARFDVILGSDMICCASDAEGVAAVVARHLTPGGFAVFLLPPPRTRYGVDALPAALCRAGLRLEQRPLHPAYLAPAAREEEQEVIAGGYEAALVLHVVTRG
jgi:predicted nicotinamide N-methyase